MEREGASDEVEVLLLGPIEVRVGGEPVALTARMHRNLVALLALDPGRVHGVDRIVDALWGDEPPASAVGTLHSYVSLLRRTLGDRARERPVLARRNEGYLLDLVPEAVDAVRFEGAVARAAQQPPEEAWSTLDRALAAWRGPAPGEAATEPSPAPARFASTSCTCRRWRPGRPRRWSSADTSRWWPSWRRWSPPIP